MLFGRGVFRGVLMGALVLGVKASGVSKEIKSRATLLRFSPTFSLNGVPEDPVRADFRAERVNVDSKISGSVTACLEAAIDFRPDLKGLETSGSVSNLIAAANLRVGVIRGVAIRLISDSETATDLRLDLLRGVAN